MELRHVLAVQHSHARIAPQADAVARRFYARLFELEPDLRRLFQPDMASQRDKLMAVLAAAVDGLGRIEALVPLLEGLGARHARYGVRDAHYDVVGRALLDALADAFDERGKPELLDAWARVYALLAGAMKAGAAQASRPVPA